MQNVWPVDRKVFSPKTDPPTDFPAKDNVWEDKYQGAKPKKNIFIQTTYWDAENEKDKQYRPSRNIKVTPGNRLI